LIQKHNFWEIGNGQHALFWEDAWQQCPSLDKEIYRPIKEYLDEKNNRKLKDYWKNTETFDWRNWKNLTKHLPIHLHQPINSLNRELINMQIQRMDSLDILRWGSKSEGTFNIKEAYNLLKNPTSTQADNKWKKLWSRKHWLKIILFLWQITHMKILTWDSLQKKGFNGPSVCGLCLFDSEMTKHLLNTCPFASNIWSWFLLVFEPLISFTTPWKIGILPSLASLLSIWPGTYFRVLFVGLFGRSAILELSGMQPPRRRRSFTTSKQCCENLLPLLSFRTPTTLQLQLIAGSLIFLIFPSLAMLLLPSLFRLIPRI